MSNQRWTLFGRNFFLVHVYMCTCVNVGMGGKEEERIGKKTFPIFIINVKSRKNSYFLIPLFIMFPPFFPCRLPALFPNSPPACASNDRRQPTTDTSITRKNVVILVEKRGSSSSTTLLVFYKCKKKREKKNISPLSYWNKEKRGKLLVTKVWTLRDEARPPLV